MTSCSDASNQGIESCRTWESQPDEGDRIVWSVDSRDGVMQGPLDFQFLQGKKILMRLGPCQVALLTREGQLKAVFLEGAHPLTIGNRPEHVPPDSELFFLAADRPLLFSWHRDSSLWVSGGTDQSTCITIRGQCICNVSGPAQFFAAFLRHSSGIGEPFTLRVIDALVRSCLEKALNESVRGCVRTEEELSACLRGIAPADLNSYLEDLGLLCNELRIDAARIEPGATQSTTGQSTADRVNRI